MGSFRGHILPGTFFIIIATWWSFMATIRYIKCRNRNQNSISKSIVKKYTTSATMPCICLPRRIRKFPIESIVKLVFTTIGILGEVITGIKKYETTILPEKNSLLPQMNENHHHHQHQHHHVRDGESTGSSWYFGGNNAQHATMYAAFGIGAIVEILVHYKVHVPLGLEFITGIFAFAIEALLFQFHLHGRDDLDIHIHVLLIIAIYACLISCILEYINPHNVLFTYSRICFTLLQGTWFYQAAFILFSPFKALENLWDATNHQHIMFITMSFIWHFLFIFISLLIQFLLLNRLFGTKYSIIEDVESIEDSHHLEYLMLDHTMLLNSNSKIINETSLKNNQSDDNDSETVFDNSKVFRKSTNNS
jgi:hypothetical protein